MISFGELSSSRLSKGKQNALTRILIRHLSLHQSRKVKAWIRDFGQIHEIK